MYCPIDNNDSYGTRCLSRCCRLYNIALALLAALILFAVGLIIGVSFVGTFIGAIPLLIAAVVILFILFIVTLLTRGCCNFESRE